MPMYRFAKRTCFISLCIGFYMALCFMCQPLSAQEVYFPPAGSWEMREPAMFGVHEQRLQEAIAFAKKAESKNPRSMEQSHYQSFGREPFGNAIGPFADRGDQTGIIIYKGYCIAKWGEPDRCDMTHSVTKSFLSAVVGIASERGHIHNLGDKVATYMAPIEIYDPGVIYRSAEDFMTPELLQPFSSAQNALITWEHLLRQTSNWQGTLWGKPDWADRPDKDAAKWLDTLRPPPGSFYEYNDVRVNLLALATTMVLRKPLPEVLKQEIMDKIGASNTWRWTGYRNAWIVLDGRPVQSVSGGGHWGGGMIINAWDMARFGYFTLRKGLWGNEKILSDNFFEQATTPGAVKDDYGFMNYFLNTGKKMLPSAPATAYCHIGNGTNMVYIDVENDVVAVVRWFDNSKMNDIVEKILAALPSH